MKFLKAFHNHFSNSNVKVVNPNHAKISDNNVINGNFKVFNFKNDVKDLNRVFESVSKESKISKKRDIEDTRLYNESRTGYTNPVTHTINMNNGNAYNI